MYNTHTHIYTHLDTRRHAHTHTHTLHPTSHSPHQPQDFSPDTFPGRLAVCVRTTTPTSLLPTPHTHTCTHTRTYTFDMTTNHKRDSLFCWGGFFACHGTLPVHREGRGEKHSGGLSMWRNLCMNVTRTDARSSPVCPGLSLVFLRPSLPSLPNHLALFESEGALSLFTKTREQPDGLLTERHIRPETFLQVRPGRMKTETTTTKNKK